MVGMLSFCSTGGSVGRRERRQSPRWICSLGGKGGLDGGGLGKKPPRRPPGPPKRPLYYDPDRSERPPWADALWSILRFHLVFGLVVGLYAHVRIRWYGLWTAVDTVPITGRRRRLMETINFTGDHDEVFEEFGTGMSELQVLAEQVLERVKEAGKRCGLPESKMKVVLKDHVPDGQLALSLLDPRGDGLILIDGQRVMPSQYAAVISHEAAHHFAKHLTEMQTLLYATETPFCAFQPLAPFLLLTGLINGGIPNQKRSGPWSIVKSLQTRADFAVKLMFLDRIDVVEQFFIGLFNPWKQQVELEADKIGAILCAHAGFNPKQYIPMLNSFKSENKIDILIRSIPFVTSHPIPLRRIEELKKMDDVLEAEFQRNSKASRIETRLNLLELELGYYLDYVD